MTVDVAKSVRKMFVDGKWVDSESGHTFDAVSPATGETIASVPKGSRADAQRAVVAAHKARRAMADLIKGSPVLRSQVKSGDLKVVGAVYDLKTGRVEWVSDLAEIPAKYGVNNVYGDMGQLFATTLVAQPRLATFVVATLLKGLGPERLVWGTDALWTGSPQWQIEGLRRMEVPDDMQKKYGFKPLGAADGPIKTAIFSGNSARLYNYPNVTQWSKMDRFSALKEDYLKSGPNRTNLRYGYVAL